VNKVTLVSLGYPLSVFNQNSTLKQPATNMARITIPAKTEAHLKRTIHHHEIHSLTKDLTLHDPGILTFHLDKLKQSQDALDKLQKTKKQDKLLATFTQDVAHYVNPLTTNKILCGTTSRNSRITKLLPHCRKKPAPSQVLTTEFGNKDPQPS